MHSHRVRPRSRSIRASGFRPDVDVEQRHRRPPPSGRSSPCSRVPSHWDPAPRDVDPDRCRISPTSGHAGDARRGPAPGAPAPRWPRHGPPARRSVHIDQSCHGPFVTPWSMGTMIVFLVFRIDDAFQTDLFSSHNNSSRPIRFQESDGRITDKIRKAIAEQLRFRGRQRRVHPPQSADLREKRHLPLSDTVRPGAEAFTTH